MKVYLMSENIDEAVEDIKKSCDVKQMISFLNRLEICVKRLG